LPFRGEINNPCHSAAKSLVIPQQSEGFCFLALSFRSKAKDPTFILVIPQRSGGICFLFRMTANIEKKYKTTLQAIITAFFSPA
jgi:hypothetical protein